MITQSEPGPLRSTRRMLFTMLFTPDVHRVTAPLCGRLSDAVFHNLDAMVPYISTVRIETVLDSKKYTGTMNT